MNIITHTYSWKKALSARVKTKYIILHHRAGNGDVESIHKTHLANGWAGIGYHFYIRKNGEIHQGRPIKNIGAHCEGFNAVSIGICFEGNFQNEAMPKKQFDAGRELINYIRGLYPEVEIKKHEDFNSTVCPGKNFPFDEITTIAKKELESANDIVWELMNGPLKVEISEVDRAVDALNKAKTENSSLYWILKKLANR